MKVHSDHESRNGLFWHKQVDNHPPYFSVAETMDFAYSCQAGFNGNGFNLPLEVCRAKLRAKQAAAGAGGSGGGAGGGGGRDRSTQGAEGQQRQPTTGSNVELDEFDVLLQEVSIDKADVGLDELVNRERSEIPL